eukprot:13033428-Heterocapsa_arctica.AAC.1
MTRSRTWPTLLRRDRRPDQHYFDYIDGLAYIMGRGLLPRELWVQRVDRRREHLPLGLCSSTTWRATLTGEAMARCMAQPWAEGLRPLWRLPGR